VFATVPIDVVNLETLSRAADSTAATEHPDHLGAESIPALVGVCAM